jgi:putative N-acetylmannosamine-6-phosphate epimerase
MAAKRNPTNADIIREVKNMQTIVSDTVKDVEALKEWRVAVMAVDEYKRREGNGAATSKSPNEWLNRELIKMFGLALGVIGALVVLAQSLVK